MLPMFNASEEWREIQKTHQHTSNRDRALMFTPVIVSREVTRVGYNAVFVQAR